MFLTFHVWLRLTTSIKPTWWCWVCAELGITEINKIRTQTEQTSF